MLTIFARKVFTAVVPGVFLALGLATAAWAAPTRSPTLEDLEALCPGSAGSPQQFGSLADDAPRPAEWTDRAAFAAFELPELTYTSWSQQLAAVTIRAASPDGDVNRNWQAATEAALLVGGWRPVADRSLATPLDEGALFEKSAGSGEGARRLLFEVATPGAQMLRCGDQTLLQLDRDEAEGRLSPGSRRPLPLAGEPPLPLPKPADCDQPDLLAALRGPERIDEDAPAFVRFEARAGQTLRQAQRAERIYRWLQWRVLQSDRIDRERLWEIEEQTAPLVIEPLEDDLGQLLAGAGEAFRARQRGDTKGMCLALVPTIVSRARADARAAERHQALADALEAEAKRLAIPLD